MSNVESLLPAANGLEQVAAPSMAAIGWFVRNHLLASEGVRSLLFQRVAPFFLRNPHRLALLLVEERDLMGGDREKELRKAPLLRQFGVVTHALELEDRCLRE